MSRCKSCGNKSSKIEVNHRPPQGVRTTRQSRMPIAKPIIQQIARPIVKMIPKLANANNSTVCPLCGSQLRAISQTHANKTNTFFQCAGSCDYRRKA